MEAPDKIYLAFDKGFVAQASNVKEDVNGNSIFLPEYTPISYIRKDALLKWAVETYLAEKTSAIRKACFKKLVDRLMSM